MITVWRKVRDAGHDPSVGAKRFIADADLDFDNAVTRVVKVAVAYFGRTDGLSLENIARGRDRRGIGRPNPITVPRAGERRRPWAIGRRRQCRDSGVNIIRDQRVARSSAVHQSGSRREAEADLRKLVARTHVANRAERDRFDPEWRICRLEVFAKSHKRHGAM